MDGGKGKRESAIARRRDGTVIARRGECVANQVLNLAYFVRCVGAKLTSIASASFKNDKVEIFLDICTCVGSKKNKCFGVSLGFGFR